MSDSKVFMTYWQGGDRYAENISVDGEEFSLPFEERNYLYDEELWEQLKDVKMLFRHIDLSEIFSNSNPVNFEVGIGNGEFLAHHANLSADENWLGVEVYRKIFHKAVKKAANSKFNNMKVIQFDVALILRLFPDRSLNAAYVNFPDPWPKKSHTRRRLLKPCFLQLLSDKLRSGGLLHIATDHTDYAMEIAENLNEVKSLKSINDTSYVHEKFGYFSTSYHKKFGIKGQTYYFTYKNEV